MHDHSQGVGQHELIEFWGATNLDSAEIAERALREAVDAGGATLLSVFVHRFEPHGVSAVAVIAESHLSIHTWPELGYCAADVFTCGSRIDMDAMRRVLERAFMPDEVTVRRVARGRLSGEPVVFLENEPLSATSASYQVDRVLERRRSEFQDVFLFESPRLGRVLTLDGIVQQTDLDTYVYHELLAHPALMSHPDPQRVAVIGGGDGHLVRTVLQHDSVEQVLLCEHDEEVINVCRKHYPEIDRSLADPRTTIVVGDAFETLGALDGELDAILVDLTDPIGPAVRLFEDGFYEVCDHALRHEGFLVAQLESLHYHPDIVRNSFGALRNRFTHAELLWGALATYPGAFWTFGIASNGLDPTVVRRRQTLDSRLYNAESHGWFFLPQPVRESMLAER